MIDLETQLTTALTERAAGIRVEPDFDGVEHDARASARTTDRAGRHGPPRRLSHASRIVGIAAAAGALVVGLGAIALSRADLGSGVAEPAVPVSSEPGVTVSSEPGVTVSSEPSSIDSEPCAGCPAATTADSTPDTSNLLISDVEISSSDWVVLDPVPDGFEAVLTDETRVVYVSDTGGTFVVYIAIFEDDPLRADGDIWTRRDVSEGVVEYGRPFGRNATVWVTVDGIDDETSRALLSDLRVVDARPAARLNQQGPFEGAGTFETGVAPVSVSVQIADPWFCIGTQTPMGPGSVECGLLRTEAPLTLAASHSRVEGSPNVTTRIEGIASDDVSFLEATFSDGHTVQVAPLPVPGHPGWNTWALETETEHELSDPLLIANAFVSATAYDATGDVLATVSE